MFVAGLINENYHFEMAFVKTVQNDVKPVFWYVHCNEMKFNQIDSPLPCKMQLMNADDTDAN